MDVPHAVSAPIPPYPQISADSQRSSSFIKPHQPSSTTRHFFLVRLELVKELVRRDDCDRASLYCYSGFSSMIDLRRVFKALTGQTLSQWRAAGTRDAIMG